MNDGSITMTTSAGTTTVPGYVAGTWDIDPVHSEVGFAVRHMMVSKVRGKFKTFSGQIDTGNEQRDGHIRSADFFEVEKHTTMTFRSTGVRAAGDGFVVDGDLTLKDVTKQVPLTLELNGFGPDPYGGTRAGFTATAEINRSEFGIDFNAALETGGVVVSDKVAIQIEIEAVLKARGSSRPDVAAGFGTNR